MRYEKESEDGPTFYEVRDGKWTVMTGYGYQQPAYNAGWIMLHYFEGGTLFASGEIRQIASVEKRQFGSAEIRQFESIEKSQS